MKIMLSFILASLLSGCVSWNRGLEPTTPKYSGKSYTEQVNSLTPRLEWMPYTRADGKTNFHYQLQIWDGNVLIVDRDNIQKAEYFVEQPLLPNHNYRWQVRPVWSENGTTQGENWNDKKFFLMAVVYWRWGWNAYHFTTPNIKPEITNETSLQPEAAKQPSPTLDSRNVKTEISNEEESRLKKLHQLHKQGLLTDKEYKEKKMEILKSL